MSRKVGNALAAVGILFIVTGGGVLRFGTPYSYAAIPVGAVSLFLGLLLLLIGSIAPPPN